MPAEFNNAEEALARFYERVADGEQLDFDDYCRQWPQWADEMRAERARLDDLGDLLHRVALRPGSVANPGVAGEVDAPLGPTLSRTLKQLEQDPRARARYEVRDEIGHGGMGVVFRAWDLVLKREVAMKCIRAEHDGAARPRRSSFASRSIGRFVEEAQITAQLDHPGIVPIYDIGLDERDSLYFTMRLIEGRTLSEIFDRHRESDADWSLARVVGLLLRVCETLAFAHSRGVVHRDLKPSNVMVGDFGEVYVLDWGLARIVGKWLADRASAPEDAATRARGVSSDRTEDHDPGSGLRTRQGDVLGTLAYMSPEQATGSPDSVGPPSDVYAVGAMLYELLARHAPFAQAGESPSQAQVLERLRAGPPEPLDAATIDANGELAAICNKAMARSVGERYASTSALADDLRAYTEGRVVSAHRVDLATVMRKWIARNRGLSRTIGAAIAIVVGVTIGFIVVLNQQVHETQAALVDAGKKTRERNRLDHPLRIDSLIAQAEQLYPTNIAQEPALQKWLNDADALLVERGEHVTDRQAALAFGDAKLAVKLDQVLASFDELQRVRSGVALRLELARTLEQRSLDAHADEWKEAIEAIENHPRYVNFDGTPMTIEPQIGLVPLRENPRSHLWEFWMIDSGARPEHMNADTGSWQITSDTGLVLVLVPAVQLPDSTTHPFFCGKYEVTQAQWTRLMGKNPAEMCAGRPRKLREIDIAFDDRHPVEMVDWYDARRYCSRLDLVLPLNAQWSIFAIGSSVGDRWTGKDVETLYGKENVRGDPGKFTSFDTIDDFPYHAPVGSMQGNDAGAFDMLGNVCEWVRDPSDPDSADDDGQRYIRGGDYQSDLHCASAVFFGQAAVHFRSSTIGFRVARPLRPCPWGEQGPHEHK